MDVWVTGCSSLFDGFIFWKLKFMNGLVRGISLQLFINIMYQQIKKCHEWMSYRVLRWFRYHFEYHFINVTIFVQNLKEFCLLRVFFFSVSTRRHLDADSMFFERHTDVRWTLKQRFMLDGHITGWFLLSKSVE